MATRLVTRPSNSVSIAICRSWMDALRAMSASRVVSLAAFAAHHAAMAAASVPAAMTSCMTSAALTVES